MTENTKTRPRAARTDEGGNPEAETQRYSSVDVGSIRRKQIIGAVRQIIARDGIEAVTIANIATELGTSRGVVVYHFDNKEEILHEVLVSAMRDADRSALRIGSVTLESNDYASVVTQVAKLARSTGDWWRIYFAYLAHAHVNPVYREALAWSDENYRTALARTLGDTDKAAIMLALMKGLAMQMAVTPDLPIDRIAVDLQTFIDRWQANGASA